jgi:hypothetical protein
VHRIGVVARLHHIVLFIALHAVLWAERRRDAHVIERHQRIERVRKITRHRCRVRHQRHALAFERRTQRRIFQQPINAKLHGSSTTNPSAA